MSSYIVKIVNINYDQLQLVLPIASIVIASIALIWNVVRDFYLSRPNFIFSAYLGSVVNDEQGRLIATKGKQPTAGDIIFVGTNVGRSGIWINFIIVEYKDGSSLNFTFNKYLKPYEQHTIRSLNIHLKKDFTSGTINSIYAIDTKSKKWFLNDYYMKGIIDGLQISNKPLD